jgi:hypothetical protein
MNTLPQTEPQTMPPAEPSPAAKWAAEMNDLIDDLAERLPARMRRLFGAKIPDGDPDELTALFLALFARLGGHGRELWETGVCNVAGSTANQLQHAVESGLRNLAAALRPRLKQLLAAGRNDPASPVITTLGLKPENQLSWNQKGYVYPQAATFVDALPTVVRDALPPGAGYTGAGDRPILLLGRFDRQRPAWVPLTEAVAETTEAERAYQRGLEHERTEREYRERKRREAWEQSPEGQRALQAQKIADLEAQVAAMAAGKTAPATA